MPFASAAKICTSGTAPIRLGHLSPARGVPRDGLKYKETGQLMMSTTTPRRKKPAATAVIAISALMAGLTAAESAIAQQAPQMSRRAAVAQGPVINRVAIEGNSKVEKALIEGELQTRPRT